MKRALRATLAVLVIVAGASSASAAVKKPAPKPKPLCNLVTDVAGDVKTGDGSLDVISADVATNKDTLTVVFRVAKLAASDSMAPAGRYYGMSFTTPDGLGQTVTATLGPTGNIWNGTGVPSASTGTGVVDLAKNEVRVSVPFDHLVGHPVLKPGTLLTHLSVRVDLGNPVVGAPSSGTLLGDQAVSTKSYPIGAASCVAVGK